ncbi:FeoB-associated Cys-rich membrane protein [Pseudoflavonifractor phocaeensis]|uniref:FeoB-associated Cys-rich membrane protein n=1 Tax=Pseudoflavonifractor phocaeensis TaxID=1870988 RepID=UPI00195BB121|nr:FeoB-associated Cys-rich membrane protein [Pseudoflavonifractor phocaeensis]MBM6724960.1 FeoB-associated Cys-rich membrane protein [Pseudoflavonifractor phocaeensis]HJB99755.1 FeoB-associated Cys-rich membrane protein [Candidatus Flavonifractor merdavium]
MLPSILIGLVIAAICVAIIARGIHNKRNGKGGCSCGGSCGSCGCSGLCHPPRKSHPGSTT